METVTYDVEDILKKIDETHLYSAFCSEDIDNTCCIGGALCRQLDPEAYSFPYCIEVAKAIMKVNPLLSEPTAQKYANQIICENDRFHFTKSKEMMREALTWKP